MLENIRYTVTSLLERLPFTVISSRYTANTEDRAAIPIGDFDMSNIPSPRMEHGLKELRRSSGISHAPPVWTSSPLSSPPPTSLLATNFCVFDCDTAAADLCCLTGNDDSAPFTDALPDGCFAPTFSDIVDMPTDFGPDLLICGMFIPLT